MYKTALLFVLLFFGSRSACQSLRSFQQTDKGNLSVQTGILPDNHYNIRRLSSDTSLHFRRPGDSVAVGYVYWLKLVVANPNASQRNYMLTINPQLRNTLYHFDPDRKTWLASTTDAANNTGSRLPGRHAVSFSGKSNATIYVRIDLTGFGHRDELVKLALAFQPEAEAAGHEQTIRTAWICCMVVLLVFLLNNIYIYRSFRDKAVLYYLIAQIGGMVYITAYRWIFYLFLHPFLFNIDVHEKITYYDLNKIIIHLAVLLVLYSISNFTRIFLNTRRQLPHMDKALRYGVNIYAIATIGAMLVNVAGFNLEYYTLPYDNLFCALLVSLIMATGMVAYQRKIPFAATFLIANGLPFVFMLGIPVSHLVISLQNEENLWIPELAVITQALAFSIALVARTRTIQDALSASEITNQQLEFNLKEAGYRAQLHQMEIAKISADMDTEKVKNDLLQERLEANQRELASSTLYMVQKNELLSHLKSQMELLSRPNPSTSQGMRAMSTLIENSTLLDSDWAKFKMHFEQVHPHFFENLKTRHPNLTTKETRLYAYFHMQLSHKEIAALLNIDPASVRRAKTRLFKKMAIPESE